MRQSLPVKKLLLLKLRQRSEISNILIYPPSQYPGIIVLRLSRLIIKDAISQLVSFIEALSEEKIKGRLAIVEPDRVRFR